MLVQIKGVSQGSARFVSRTSVGKASITDYWYAKLDTTTTDVGNGVAIDSSGNVYVVGTRASTDVIVLKYNNTGSLVWQRKLSGASSTESGNGIAVDNLGNVYIVGTINNGVTDDILIAKYNTSGTLLWQTTLASANVEGGNGIAVDSSGNVYITGASNYVVLIAKFDTNGNILWQRSLGGAGSQYGTGIAVDNLSNVYIVGNTNNGDDLIIAKYDTSGTFKWQSEFYTNIGGSNDFSLGCAIAVDSSGNVYITGKTDSDLSDIIIAKYNGSLGTVLWQRKLSGASSTESGNGIAVDSSGNVYITGYTGTDIIIAKYDTNGNISPNGWKRTLASTGTDVGRGIAVDSSGTNVYITGSIDSDLLIARLPANGSIVNPTYTGKLKLIHSASSLTDSSLGFESTLSTLTSSTPTLNSFKCDLYSSDPALTSAIVASGVPVSSTSTLTPSTSIAVGILTTSSSDTAYGIAVDPSGNVYLNCEYNSRAMVAKYDKHGIVQWQRNFGNSFDRGRGIAVDSSGNVYACVDANNDTIIILKFNASGTIQWQRSLASCLVSSAQMISVDSSANVYVVATTTSNDIIIAKFNTNGVIQWQRRLTGSSTIDAGRGIAVDSSGNVYIIGSTGSYNAIIAKYNTNGTIQWQRTLAGAQGNGISIDSSGNVYITGVTQTINNILIAKYNTNGDIQWQRTLASADDEYGRAIATDSSGTNVYITGYTYNNGLNNNIVIAKYNSSGTLQWQRIFGRNESAQNNYGFGIAVDSFDNVYISGETNSTTTGKISYIKIPSDGGITGTYGVFSHTASTLTDSASTLTDSASTLTDSASVVVDAATVLTFSTTISPINSPITIQTLASAGTDSGNGIAIDSSGNYYITGNTGTDILIAKYNSSGVIQWQRTLASTGTDAGNGIAVDVSGNVYITGHTYSSSTPHILIAKYDTSGTLLWQTNLTSINQEYGNGIAVDSSGNVYITGSTNNIAVAYSSDAVIVKCNTLGVIQWQRKLVGTYDNYAYTIAVDSSGNAYIGGSDRETDGFNRDIHIIAKYNTSGTLLWQKKLDDGSANDTVKGIAVDSIGNVYITGTSNTNIDGSNQKILIAKYDTNGTLTWQRKLASTNSAIIDIGNAIAADSSGNAYITGNTDTDILIAKYDTNGNNTWQRKLAGAGTDVGNGIVIDSSSTNVYITGSTGTDIIIAKIPSGGGDVGTYGSVSFASTSLTSSTSTYTAGTSVLTDSAGPFIGGKNAWISTFGASGSSLESASGIALDSAKNIYTIGKTLHTSGTTDSLLVKYNNSGTMQWQRTLTGSNSNDSGNGIAIDSSDNIYTVGTTGSNANDIVISKYNTSGVIQWQAILGTSTAQVGFGIAVDSSSNVYISGYTNNGSNTDALIAKYNSSGTIQWQRTLNLGFIQGDFGYGIAVDSSANVYISGSGVYGNGSDTLVAKYDTNGNINNGWQRYMTGAASANAIAVDSSGNAFITGESGPNAILVAKYHTSGTLEWQRGLNSAGTDIGYGIAVDVSGNPYIIGKTGTDIIIAKYNGTTAAVVWQCTLTGASTTDIGTGIKVDGDYVYITGSTSTGAKSLIAKLPNDGSYTGTYGSFTYATSSLSETLPALANGSASWATGTPTLTSSLILSSTELNASSVNNYLR